MDVTSPPREAGEGYTGQALGEEVGSVWHDGEEMGSVLILCIFGLMARPPRLEFSGAVYHVVRGNEQSAIFRDHVDRARYLERLAHYRNAYRSSLEVGFPSASKEVPAFLGTKRRLTTCLPVT